MRGRRIDASAEEIFCWKAQYVDGGLSIREIAERYGYSKNWMRDKLIIAGVIFDKNPRISRKLMGRPSPRKGAKLSPEQRARIGEGHRKPGAEIRLIQRRAFKSLLLRSLRQVGGTKRGNTAELLGYSGAHLAAHIEKQFRPRMSWGQRSTFHIDHIVPVIEFIKRGVTDPKIVCSLINLQPLFPAENRTKHATYTGDFAVDLAKIISFNGG